MSEINQSYRTIDEYIALCPPDVREKLETLRRAIHETAPSATEKISYRMPTFYLKGNLVHFAAFKRHIGFYPGASGIENFKDRFGGYAYSKGAVQFPLDQPLPLDLVREIVRFRAAENLRESESKHK